MKKIGIILIALLSFTVSTGQSPHKADALLKEVSEKMKGYENILIDFKYSIENPSNNAKHETRGDVSLKGNKYVLNIMGTTRIFDGENLYTIIPADEEIIISAYDPEKDHNINPSKMLTFYKNGYTAEWDIVQDLNGRKIQYVKLTPAKDNTEIDNILLGIDKQTKHIYNLIQTLEDGSKVTITVTSFKVNQPLSKTLFEFKKDRYEEYYINRLN